MDKLTQFVSKSFESNNNTDQCLNLTSVKSVEGVIKCEQDSPIIKDESRSTGENRKIKTKPVAKNWLISDSPSAPIEKSTSPSLGIDLRLNNNSGVIYSSSLVINNKDRDVSHDAKPSSDETAISNRNRHHQPSDNVSKTKSKWFYEDNIEVSRNSYSSSSSPSPPIDLEDSKSCSETQNINEIVTDKDGKHVKAVGNGNNTEKDNKICESLEFYTISGKARCFISL